MSTNSLATNINKEIDALYLQCSCYMLDLFIYTILVRMEHTIDMSTAIKFVYVHWVGKNVPFAKKGRFGVVSGSVKALFNVSSRYMRVCVCVRDKHRECVAYV